MSAVFPAVFPAEFTVIFSPYSALLIFFIQPPNPHPVKCRHGRLNIELG
jgi:hypothetical protein